MRDALGLLQNPCCCRAFALLYFAKDCNCGLKGQSFAMHYGRAIVRSVGFALLCGTAVAARAETFLIQADESGHEATIKIPVGAVATLSANSCESLTAGDPGAESMRLSGDVLISIAGSAQPIEIKADKIVLELTADELPEHKKPKVGDSVSQKLLSSSTILAGANHSQVFLGNVVFNLQTASGPVEIKADRVEHQMTEHGATEAGA